MTIQEIRTCKEGQTFDCKSIQIEPKALAIPIVAFANADGGVIAIGVSDKTRKIEGVDQYANKLNELLRVPFDFCNPSVPVTCTYMPCTDEDGNENRILLMHIPASSNAFFRIGYIEAWGRGIGKMNSQCAAAGLPQPQYYYESSGFWVVFRKDLFNEEDLQAKGLNPRQIKAVLYAKENGKISNKVYQEINECSRATANRDLTELVKMDILSFNDNYGAGANYSLKIIAS